MFLCVKMCLCVFVSECVFLCVVLCFYVLMLGSIFSEFV